MGGEPPVESVLVIGGAGYIGSALLPKLLDGGYRVRVLDLMFYGTDPIAPVLDHPNLELIEGDLRHVESVVTAMRGMDAVVHLGAIVGDPACNLDEELTIAVNLRATQMIADVAKASGIRRFLFASTCSVYGAGNQILDESSPAQPISLYGRTKLAAERGLRRMSDENFYPTICRFGTIYGFSGRTRFDLVINLLTAKARTEGVITVHGGDQWRPFVHVDDAALAVYELLTAPFEVVGDQTFNVGSNAQNMTIADVGRLIKEIVPDAELSIDLDDTDKRDYRVNFDKITKAVGFEPQWTVESGIHQILDAIDSGAVTDYQATHYSNVKHLQESGMDIIIRLEENDWTLELDPAGETPATLAAG